MYTNELVQKDTKIGARRLVLFSVMVFLMILSAQVKIYLFFTPIPITLQTFFLFLSIAYCAKDAWLVQALYLFLGLLGLPVFSGNVSGWSALVGPTGGYILGFLLTAFIMGRLWTYFNKSRIYNTIGLVLFFAISNIIVYFLGVSWLCIFYNYNLHLAIAQGVIPFIMGDILKIVLAALIIRGSLK